MPQGSVIGPSKFIVYKEELDCVIQKRKLDYHMYADDIQMLSCMNIHEIAKGRLDFEECVTDVQDWCTAYHLALNATKTELMWFGSRSNITKLNNQITTIHLNTVDIMSSKTVRDLGLLLDATLDMHAHIGKVVSAGFFHLRTL